jgi:hypothetical protein
MLKDKETCVHFYFANQVVAECDYNPCRIEDTWYRTKIGCPLEMNEVHKALIPWIENEFKSIGQNEEMFVNVHMLMKGDTYTPVFDNRGENNYFPDETHHSLKNRTTIWLRIGETELRISNVDGRPSITRTHLGLDHETIM